MAGGAIASVMQDEFPDFNTFEYSGEIKFKDIDFTRLTEPIIVDLRKYLKIGNCYEPVIIEKICTITSVDLYGFKIMAGEKTVGVLIYEKNSRNTSKLTMWCLVLYQNLRSLINIQKIIQKIEQDNIDNVTLYTDLISVEDDFQGQQKVFYLEFGFQELSDKENKFQMKLNQVVTTDEDTLRSSMRVPSVSMRTASASGAGAASATAENSIKFDSEEGRALIQEFLYESLQAKST